jgi:hypothetical protein
VGDKNYADIVDKLMPNNVIRFVNNNDIVPRVPLPLHAPFHFRWVFMGYKSHFAKIGIMAS